MSKYATIPIVDTSDIQKKETRTMRCEIEKFIKTLIQHSSKYPLHYFCCDMDFDKLTWTFGSKIEAVKQIAKEEFDQLNSNNQVKYEVVIEREDHLSWPILKAEYKPGGF